MYLITKWFGTFLCDETGIKESIFFPKDIEEIVQRLQVIDDNKILQEEQNLAEKTSDKIIVGEKRLEKIGVCKPNNSFFKTFEIDSEEYGYSKKMLVEATKKKTQQKVKKELADEEVYLIHAVNTLEDMQEILHLLEERLRGWNKIYDALPVDNHAVAATTRLSKNVTADIKQIEKQVTNQMKMIAPNLSVLVGPIIGARLIAQAGSLKRLASFPSSTVQVLGAEKALFRYKKEGGKPPKHGIIFQHHLVRTAPRDVRGKIARGFAGKISTAAKADAFTGRDIGEELKQAFEKQVKAIKRKH